MSASSPSPPVIKALLGDVSQENSLNVTYNDGREGG